MNYKKEIRKLLRMIDSGSHERILRAIYISLRDYVKERCAA